MAETIGYSPEIRFWKGTDAVLTSPTRIPAHGYEVVNVLLPQGSLPHFLVDRPELAHEMHAATRSILAQCGLEVDDKGSQLYDTIRNNPRIVDDEDGVRLAVQVNNYAGRDIKLPEGIKLFRSYYQDSRTALRNGELLKLAREGQIQVSGTEGEDWFWRHNADDKIDGMIVKVSPARKWIEPDLSAPAIEIPKEATSKNYRGEIDKLLVPVPETPEMKLWIGETQPIIKLGDSVCAMIHSMVSPVLLGEGAFEAQGTHTSSRVVDENSHWRIRLEVLSSTQRAQVPKHAFIYFVKAV